MSIQKSICAIDKWLSMLGLLLLLLVASGVTVEVISRRFLSVSLGGVDELSGYAFAVFTSFAFVLAVLEKVNIRIDLVRSAAPRGMKIAMDLISAFVLLGFVSLLSTRAVLLALNSYEKGSKAITPLATPLYIPQALWAAGLVTLTLVLIATILLALRAILARDFTAFWHHLAPVHEEDHADEYTSAVDTAQEENGT